MREAIFAWWMKADFYICLSVLPAFLLQGACILIVIKWIKISLSIPELAGDDGVKPRGGP